jgi:TetR/AcrR family transcriptional repressor of nem operon
VVTVALNGVYTVKRLRRGDRIAFGLNRESSLQSCPCCSFMSAEFDDLPHEAKTEIQVFADVNIAWLKKILVASKVASPSEAEKRAPAIYAGIVGAQLMARSRADTALYDSLIETYRSTGLLPS